MTKRFWIMLLSFCLLAVLAACGQKAEAQPQPIDEKVDTCAQCHMAIKNNGYAAQYVTTDGKSLKFDDIGCLHKYEGDHKEDQIAARFVQDSQSKEWLKLENASYVLASSVPTPMGYGVHAFKDKTAADAFVKEKATGTVMSYTDLQKHEWKMDKGNMMPMDGMKHGDMKQGEAGQHHMQQGDMKPAHQ